MKRKYIALATAGAFTFVTGVSFLPSAKNCPPLGNCLPASIAPDNEIVHPPESRNNNNASVYYNRSVASADGGGNNNTSTYFPNRATT
jgi:hypothetical protein